ncbi:hypothetical protein MAR_007352 [Mya arenaria]|uniref:Uncharacterized protein n=1 Tax=Mya arenaria TaxID=6604 RepID=A0ABY7DE30_MYAAR|nr:hypothetical protein MAR_007352 [Mya arenaria]
MSELNHNSSLAVCYPTHRFLRAMKQQIVARISMDRAPDLDNLQDGEIIERYRIDRNGIDFLVALLGQSIQPKALRNKALITKLLTTGPIQLNDADIHGVSLSTVSRVLFQVIAALSSPELIRRNIRLPRRI